jgi:hypothetical protein
VFGGERLTLRFILGKSIEQCQMLADAQQAKCSD